jgi:hypothetical protein
LILRVPETLENGGKKEIIFKNGSIVADTVR